MNELVLIWGLLGLDFSRLMKVYGVYLFSSCRTLSPFFLFYFLDWSLTVTGCIMS